MSTIEKAAARLASLQKNRGAKRAESKAPSAESAGSGVSALPSAGARLCLLDLEAIRAKGFLTPDTPAARLAQEMRRIKRPLLLNIQRAVAKGETDPPPNLIMVTSALPGEGKTFISINLAMSLAGELDRRVLLVDADVARGDVSRQLGIEPQRGLSDLLRQDYYLAEDGVMATNVDRLSLLPAGSPTDQVDELYASDMMISVTRNLAEADPNRVVVFDASPLLATTEAAVLARLVGQTVLVVEANQTPQDAVLAAVAQLDGCSNVSLVLNKTAGKGTAGYGGYGYGYGDAASRAEGRRDAQPGAV